MIYMVYGFMHGLCQPRCLSSCPLWWWPDGVKCIRKSHFWVLKKAKISSRRPTMVGDARLSVRATRAGGPPDRLGPGLKNLLMFTGLYT